MAAALPTPGQLVLENITLLLSSPSAFQERYGVSLTPTTFAKPGNSAEANAALHFLLSQIEPDVVDPLFKPCFPIRDREQERDFRRVVDSRLAILEKSKLLPVGASRKSVVASAGGDRFLDLLWSLSTLALQQACLRHPPYGPVSRLRLTSVTSRPESLSHQSSARSNRSLLSVVSSRSERANPDPQPLRQRRFLGVGILSATQQRSRDAEQIRARIDAERHAMHRTAELAERGENTWASEADSLRQKINHFEAKLARLKGQLADMGFDENGVDIRVKGQSPRPQSTSSTVPSDVAASERIADAATSSSAISIRTSPSGDSIADEFKTSPIDSTESGSSVDELPEPSDGVTDIAADLTRLLVFTAETRDARDRVDQTLRVEKPRFDASGSTTERPFGRNSEAADIVDLVRAATSELEEATNRMDEIQEVQRRVGENAPALGYSSSDSKFGDSESESSGIRAVSGDADTSISMVTIGEETEVKLEDRPISEPDSSSIAETPLAGAGDVSDLPKSVANSKAEAPKSAADEPPAASEKILKVVRSTDPSSNVVNIEASDAVDSPVYNIQEGSDSSAQEHEQSLLDESTATQKVATLEAVAKASTDRHQGVIEASEMLKKEAQEFVDNAEGIKSSGLDVAPILHVPSGVTESTDEKWLSEAVLRAMKGKETVDDVSLTQRVEHSNEIQAASRAFRNSVTSSRRRKDASSQSSDSINLSTARTLQLSPRYDTDVVVNPNALSSAAKNARSVRFAELPPSYSRSRGGATVRVGAAQDRLTRCATEVHPRSPRSAKHSANIAGHLDSTDVKLKISGAESDTKEGQQKYSADKRRPDTLNVDIGTDGNRAAIGVSGQKPPRLQRRQTPHRILRQKEVIQRSVCLPSKSSTSRPGRQTVVGRPQSFDATRSSDEEERKVRTVMDVSQSWDGESTKSRDLIGEVTVAMKSDGAFKEVNTDPNTSATSEQAVDSGDQDRNEKVLANSDESKFATGEESEKPISGELECQDGCASTNMKDLDMGEAVESSSTSEFKPGTESREQSLDDLGDAVSVEELGAESTNNLVSGSCSNGWNSGIQRIGTHLQSGKVGSKKSGMLRISSVGMLGSFHSRNSSPSVSSREIRVRDMSRSFDSSDSMASNGSRSESSRGMGGARSSGGFFAGETAQWQENVRQQSSPSGDFNIVGSSRSSRVSVEFSSRSSRGSGRPSVVSNNGSMRRSRVQSFRARLAALKRE